MILGRYLSTVNNKSNELFSELSSCVLNVQNEPLLRRRGGYQCRCRPGFRLPNVVRRPFLGEIVERASPVQFKTPGSTTSELCGLTVNDKISLGTLMRPWTK
jgi:hypothetical protein